MTLVFLNHETVFHCHVKRRSEWFFNAYVHPPLPSHSQVSNLYVIFQLYIFASVYGYDAVFSVYYSCSSDSNLTTYLRRAYRQCEAYIWSEYTSLRSNRLERRLSIHIVHMCLYLCVREYQLWLMHRWKKWKMRGQRDEENVARVFINLGTIGSTLVWLRVHTFIEFLIICARALCHMDDCADGSGRRKWTFSRLY